MTSQPAKPNIQTAIDFSDIPPSYNELYPQVNTEPPVSPTTTPRTETLSVTESAVTFSNQECQQRNQVVISRRARRINNCRNRSISCIEWSCFSVIGLVIFIVVFLSVRCVSTDTC
ncbi:uncharacterized protein CELE_Y26D4A.3 [Caenorhabditis elegans]|uniref:Uncharacterized protein n=1 Tax=Caenorhabditis elegans TaxID=6239 RepID=Q9U2Q2_CAEEL|nr:Uncharacterized protein CELE_Y26D4A.3 [Caenorhabditis elegans]CAB54342.3 Uncharacterized protein CELE_Y26D4A.3 [Caenorhabditis elegans]|eukprot:NP_493287.3 Uncharacterized protein CELE_Y26D4A.3 [Caenorhabditis elegans]